MKNEGNGYIKGGGIPVSESEGNRTEEKANLRGKRIYIGPALKGIMPGIVFVNGLTSAMKRVIADQPSVGELVIPVEGLIAANRELLDPESALSRFYREVINAKENEKK